MSEDVRLHEDGSLTIGNETVQRLLDYGMLHYTDKGWRVGKWTAPPRKDIAHEE